MNRFTLRIIAFVIGGFLTTNALIAQKKASQSLFDQSNLLAWCIVPFDSKNRTPEQRIEMLRRLGFSQYAYDWRHQHLDSFASEIEIARRNRVDMAAVWLWIDKGADKPGQLSEDNERMLSILKDSGLKTQLWIGFSHNYFDSLDEAGKVTAAIEMIKYIRGRTDEFATKFGLYNHGDWFGNPLNQLKITKAMQDTKVGIVYNFHHAHAQIDDLSALLTAMKPYLLAVNINGMKRSGPQILAVGSGDEEKDMLKLLVKSGYHGPIGILGHIETEDVEVVLKRNLEGLKGLASTLQDF